MKAGGGARVQFWRWARFARAHPAAAAAASFLVILAALAVLAPLVSVYGPHEKVGAVFQHPSLTHPLGLDDAGVDVVSQLIWGARVSLGVGLTAALISITLGGLVGMLSGYFGGVVDALVGRVIDSFLVLPDIAVMMVVAAIWGRGLSNVVIIIGGIYWAWTARVVRAQTRLARERGYVRRARALGCGHRRILVRHVLPQLVPMLAAVAVLQVGYAIFAETAIAFLGLGDLTVISWGRMIDNAFRGGAMPLGAWWAIVPPGLAVAAVIVSLTLVGRAIEESLNPRLRAGHLSARTFRVRRLQERSGS